MQWYNAVAPGIVTWLTRGIHLGHQRNYFAVHVDDVFMSTSRWSITGNCTPGDHCDDPELTAPDIRMTAEDVTRLTQWQDANDFAMDMAYNAAGSVEWKAGHGGADPLTDAFLAAQSEFPWINHTYSHPYLGCIQIVPTSPGQSWRCATSEGDGPREDPEIEAEMSGGTLWMSAGRLRQEIADNLAWGAANGLTDLDPAELVTGEHSGLRTLPQQPDDNPFFGPVLSELGIAQIAGDASRETVARTVGSAVTVPRHPMNIFYNTATFQELIDEYNWIYNSRADGGSGICEDNPATSTCIDPLPAGTSDEAKVSFDTYLRPLEVRNALSFILDNDPAPFYSHQGNLAEDGVLYPVVEGILTKYRSLYADNAPIVRTDMAGQELALDRLTSWGAINDDVIAYIDADGLHVPDADADVPVTVPNGTSTSGMQLQSYAGELSGWTSGAASAVLPTPMGGYLGWQDTPGAPTIGQATAGDASATVSWTAPAVSGNGPITGYTIRAYTQAAPDVVATTATVAGDATAGTVTGLTNGTAYTFRVVATNAAGAGPESERSNEVQPLAPAVPPTVVERTPAVDGTEVSPMTDVIVRFSEPVTGVDASTIMLARAGTPIPATVEYDPDTLVATLDPDVELAGGTAYTVSLSSGVRDTRGVALAPVSWSFTTGAGIAPVVTDRTPDVAAVGAAISGNVWAMFSEPVTGVSGTSFTVRPDGGSAVPAAVTYDETTRSAALDPDADLAPNTRYTVTLTGAIQDAVGNSLVETTWTFTTGDGQDPTAVVSPAPDSSGIPTTVSVSAKFSEAMAGVGGESFTLRLAEAPGDLVPAAVSYDAASSTAVLDPDGDLAAGTRYTVTFTTDVRDLAGNPVVTAQRTWSFTTAGAPTVTVSPASGATGVPADSTVTATFDVPVTGVDPTSFTLEADAGPVPATVTYDDATRVATLDPDADLEAGAAYTVRLSSTIVNAAGIPLSATTSTFTTQQAGATLTGVVSTGSGPLSGVSVNAYTADGRVWVKNATTGADGRYSLTGLPAGSYKLYVQPNEPGFANRWLGGAAFESATVVQVSGPTTVDVALTAAGSVSGVVSTGSGPLSGVSVNAYTADGRVWVKNATTGADGRYSLTGLPAGSYKLYVQPNEPGFANRWLGGAAFESATVVQVSGPTTVDVALTAAGSVSGVVSTGSGPLSGVSVNAYTADGRVWVKNATTGADGRYSLTGLPAGSYKLYVQPNEPGFANRWLGGAAFESATVVQVSGPTTVDVALTAAGSVSGVVSTGSGPLSGVSVNAYTADGRVWVKNATTGADGRYSLTGLPAGSYKLYVQPNEPGFANRWLGGAAFESATVVQVSGPTTVDVALTAAGSVSGVVSTGSGPLSGVSVNAYTADGRVWVKNATTGADGRYSLTGLPAGSYKLYVQPNEPGFANRWLGGAAFESATVVQVSGPTTVDVALGG
ncbi:Ig-like domain-containing protein [Cellulomonas sp. ATA003]|uniref:Ig-like domain-containing protein n=1 Tax=Cellulomonas sp. ATA003 TaxID=3073064 RepID=UPI002872F351|nr:Ig-like domain-containing protein [Cellulomonas sp. ATA003]WNB86359.1 Ig-like domain-containing protein [Cellulomonas sp. ATA003]